jgi:hypothetical protein
MLRSTTHARARALCVAFALRLRCFAWQATALSASTKKIEALEARLARKGTRAKRYYVDITARPPWVCGTSHGARCLLHCVRRNAMVRATSCSLHVARSTHALPVHHVTRLHSPLLMQWPMPNVRTPRWRR